MGERLSVCWLRVSRGAFQRQLVPRQGGIRTWSDIKTARGRVRAKCCEVGERCLQRVEATANESIKT